MFRFTKRIISLSAMVLLYVFAGINHLIHPDFYIGIMPDYIPEHDLMVELSGICEIALGLLLIPTQTRPVAAWLIIAMLLVFFTVHIDMVIDYYENTNPYLWAAVLRIPLQFVLIWWAWKFSKRYPKTTYHEKRV